MTSRRKEQRLSRVGLGVSIVLHATVIGILVVLAACEGMLGKHLKKIAMTMVPREAPPERQPEPPKPKPIEKPLEPKPVSEFVRVDPSRLDKTPTQIETVQSAAPPPTAKAASIAPPAAATPAFLFGAGSMVDGSSDPKALYKGFLEYTLRSNWKRPGNMVDLDYAAEVEVRIDSAGAITGNEWKKGSGNVVWDNSVRQALAQTRALERTPPKGFPEKVLVRFDVQVEADALKP